MATRQRRWQPAAPASLRQRRRNVGQTERWMSAMAGAALATAAIRRHNRQAWLLGALGTALLYRASTGNCPLYSAAGISTADEWDTRRALSGARGAHAEA
jgi:uncharacterized membrane protein